MKYADLSEDAKLKAIEWYVQDGFGYEWWDSVYDMAKHAGKILGIEIDRISFSGFWSQGDGASFAGSYRYSKGAAKAIKAEFPKDTELHSIADRLQKTQSRNFYRLRADISESGRYYNLRVSVEDSENQYRDIGAYEDDIFDAMNSFANWIYRALEREYEYLTSREQVEEAIEANEYEFSEDGRLE